MMLGVHFITCSIVDCSLWHSSDFACRYVKNCLVFDRILLFTPKTLPLSLHWW